MLHGMAELVEIAHAFRGRTGEDGWSLGGSRLVLQAVTQIRRQGQDLKTFLRLDGARDVRFPIGKDTHRYHTALGANGYLGHFEGHGATKVRTC
ncbi:hypothetical protein D9M71_313430 [compost metagenome]